MSVCNTEGPWLFKTSLGRISLGKISAFWGEIRTWNLKAKLFPLRIYYFLSKMSYNSKWCNSNLYDLKLTYVFQRALICKTTSTWHLVVGTSIRRMFETSIFWILLIWTSMVKTTSFPLHMNVKGSSINTVYY